MAGAGWNVFEKDVNSTLYAMEGQGLLRVFKESNPPKFQLIGAVPIPRTLANGENQNASTAGGRAEVPPSPAPYWRPVH